MDLVMDNLRAKTKESVKFYFLDMVGFDTETLERWSEGFSYDVIRFYDENHSYADYLNKWLGNLCEPFACLIYPNILVNENWLTELHHAYTGFENCGAIGIKFKSADLKLSTLLFASDIDDEMRGVYVTDSNFVENLIFFSKRKALAIGKFDVNKKAQGIEIKDWTFRFFALGYNNFYIKYNNIIAITMDCKILNPQTSKSTLAYLRKKLNSLLTVKKYG